MALSEYVPSAPILFNASCAESLVNLCSWSMRQSSLAMSVLIAQTLAVEAFLAVKDPFYRQVYALPVSFVLISLGAFEQRHLSHGIEQRVQHSIVSEYCF